MCEWRCRRVKSALPVSPRVRASPSQPPTAYQQGSCTQITCKRAPLAAAFASPPPPQPPSSQVSRQRDFSHAQPHPRRRRRPRSLPTLPPTSLPAPPPHPPPAGPGPVGGAVQGPQLRANRAPPKLLSTATAPACRRKPPIAPPADRGSASPPCTSARTACRPGGVGGQGQGGAQGSAPAASCLPSKQCIAARATAATPGPRPGDLLQPAQRQSCMLRPRTPQRPCTATQLLPRAQACRTRPARGGRPALGSPVRR
jgi:hypothetical protein